LLDGGCLGSSLSLRGFARVAASLSVMGLARLGSSLSVGDFFGLGASVALRSFARLGSAVSVLDFANFGSSLSVRGNVRFGSDVYACGKLYFNTNTYLEDASGSLKATVGGNTAMTLTGTGGTLHGTWYSDTVISVSDRRLKDNIAPLSKMLRKNFEDLGADSSGAGDGAPAPPGGPPAATASTFGWVLRQLRPVSYNFKTGSDSKNMRFGFIADEIEKVLPQVVRELPSKEGEPELPGGKKKGVVYPDLIAVLTGMMKEFSGQLKAVQSRVRTAELELDRLDREEPMDGDGSAAG